MTIKFVVDLLVIFCLVCRSYLREVTFSLSFFNRPNWPIFAYESTQSLDLCFFVAPTIDNGEKLCIRVCFSFFVFHVKSGTTNDHLTGLSDISY